MAVAAATVAGELNVRSLNLDQLQTLVAIADLGTFAAAARALHLAPPTVSLHISELESRLGMALLERGRRQAIPTPAGAVLIERGRKLLKEADDAVEQMRRVAEGREGKVRLGTSTGVLVHLLAIVLEALAERSPGLDVELSILSSSETMARLRARTLDIGIVAMPQPADAELQVTALRNDPMMAYLPPAWRAPRRVTPHWLAAKPLIANDASTQMHRMTAEWFGRAGLNPRARIELNYTEAMKSLVLAGYGAAVLPRESAHEIVRFEGLQIRPLDPPLHRRLGLAHRSTSELGAGIRQVLLTLREYVGALPRSPAPAPRPARGI